MYWDIRDICFCVHTVCECNYILKCSNYPLWIFEKQEATEVPCCPLMISNERCFKHINCIHVSISVTSGVLLVPSTLSIWYGCPAGGNLVSDASNFSTGCRLLLEDSQSSPLLIYLTLFSSWSNFLFPSPLDVFNSMSSDIMAAELNF